MLSRWRIKSPPLYWGSSRLLNDCCPRRWKTRRQKMTPFEIAIQIARKEGKFIVLLSQIRPLIGKLVTPVRILAKQTRITPLWCTEKGMTMCIMVHRSRWCHHQGLLAPSKIIMAIVLDGLISRCNTKDTWRLKMSFVINVTLRDIIFQIVVFPVGVEKKLLQTSNV